MKKVFNIALLITICMILTIPVFAEDTEDMIVSVDSVEAVPGESVTLSVRINGNQGIAAIILTLQYNTDILTIPENSIVNAGLLGSFETAENVVLFQKDDTENDGVLFTVTFHVSPDAEVGETYPVAILCNKCNDQNEKLLNVSTESGSITIVEEKSTIKCAQVSLGTDISVNYYADILESDAGAQMRFTMNGKETLVDGAFDEAYGLYVFPFTGITPQCMGDTIKAELILGDKVLAVKGDYSVLQNCKNLLDKTAEDLGLIENQYAAMKTLIADLMEYGAAAQVYRGYKADRLMNTDETIATLTKTKFTKWTKKQMKSILSEPEETSDINIYITAAGIYFDYQNSLYVKFCAPDLTADNFVVLAGRLNEDEEIDNPVVYKLDDDTNPILKIQDDTYMVLLEPLAAYELAKSPETENYVWFGITLNQIVEGGMTEVQRLDYCVATYVCRLQDDTTPMADLAKALYQYGHSAVAYAAIVK